jgi:hypothetical protein
VQQAIDTFGSIDTVVNNAGFVRDRMFVSAGEDEWDAVVRVHMKGHFCVARHAAAWWRDAHKAGRPVAGRIVNTSSGAGIWGSVGQAAYSAAKAGIAALTLVQSAELGRYGATANAIAPIARTRMTEGVFSSMMAQPDGGFDAMAPENVSPLVVWLGSNAAAAVTGQIFEVTGGRVTVVEGCHRGPEVDLARRWAPADLGPAVADLLARARRAAEWARGSPGRCARRSSMPTPTRGTPPRGSENRPAPSGARRARRARRQIPRIAAWGSAGASANPFRTSRPHGGAPPSPSTPCRSSRRGA